MHDSQATWIKAHAWQAITLTHACLQENVASRRLWREARQSNAAARDFTVNALLYDLGSGNLYDYCGGVADCAARQLRSVQIPTEALAADPAKIMRAVRLSARARMPPRSLCMGQEIAVDE